MTSRRDCLDAFCTQPIDENHGSTALFMHTQASQEWVQILPISPASQREQKQERPHHQTRARSAQHELQRGHCSPSGLFLSDQAFLLRPSTLQGANVHWTIRLVPSSEHRTTWLSTFNPTEPLGFRAHARSPNRHTGCEFSCPCSRMYGVWPFQFWNRAATKTRVEPPRTSQGNSTPTHPKPILLSLLTESPEFVRATFGSTSQWIHSIRYCQQKKNELTQSVSNW